MNPHLPQLLEEHKEQLQKALEALDYSVVKCKPLLSIEQANLEELESLEAMAARFARAADILTQKVLKATLLLTREEANTFVDRAHLAEKLGIVDDSKDLIQIRDLRNKIAHEYNATDLMAHFQAIHKYSPLLKEIATRVI